jgi:hypothetical protein
VRLTKSYGAAISPTAAAAETYKASTSSRNSFQTAIIEHCLGTCVWVLERSISIEQPRFFINNNNNRYTHSNKQATFPFPFSLAA